VLLIRYAHFALFCACFFFPFLILFLDTASMSRESDDNLSSINSAYTGNYTFMFHLYLIDCIFCSF